MISTGVGEICSFGYDPVTPFARSGQGMKRVTNKTRTRMAKGFFTIASGVLSTTRLLTVSISQRRGPQVSGTRYTIGSSRPRKSCANSSGSIIIRTTMPVLLRFVVTILGASVFLLAVLGRGGFLPFFSHPALAALTVLSLVIVAIALLRAATSAPENAKTAVIAGCSRLLA